MFGDPVPEPGIAGSALRVDGLGDSVVVASTPALETGSIALSLWLRPATGPRRPRGAVTVRAQNTFWRNESRGNNWVQFRLTGTTSNRDAVGARIEVTARLRSGEGRTTPLREVSAGTGFFSDFPRIQTFGLAKADALRAVVRWPSGIVQDLGILAPNQRYDVVEP